MDAEEFYKLLEQNAKEIQNFVDDIFPFLAGDIAVNHFRENFAKEGFIDNGLKKWAEVERRKPNSPWYGFAPNNKKQFSPVRAADKILKDTNELQDATDYKVTGKGEVTIVNDKPYAAVHNEGGKAYVFGKKAFQMPKRQFIGHSKELDKKILDMATKEIDKLIK